MKSIILISIQLLIFNNLHCQNYIKIYGRIKDAKTKEPLPFCTISLKNRTTGTVSNEQGFFQLFVTDDFKKDTLQVSFIGYTSFKSPVYKLDEDELLIELEPALNLIKAVTIRPFSPKEIVLKAANRLDTNYLKSHHKIEGFYLEEFKENQNYLDFAEAFIDLYRYYYTDSTKNKAYLVEGRTRDDLAEVEFMSRFNDKQYEREKRRAERKGEEFNKEKETAIDASFGGPQELLNEDPVLSPPPYITKADCNKFNYWFEKDNIFGDRELYAIGFESRRKLDYVLYAGTIYIDKQSLAIVKLESFHQVVIPKTAILAMAAFGLSVNDLVMSYDIEYKEVNNKWYLSRGLLRFQIKLKKVHMVRKNEKSTFKVKLAYIVTDIKTGEYQPPPDAKEIDGSKSLSEQVGEYHPEFWENKNVVLR